MTLFGFFQLLTNCSSVYYLVGLVVLQPTLQVSSIGSRMKTASLKDLQVLGNRGTCSHHGMESVVEGCGVLVGPLVLCSYIHKHICRTGTFSCFGECARRDAAVKLTWYQEYALSDGLMSTARIFALGSRAAALLGATSVSK